MTYKIKSTEKTTGIAADQETKAMLYLMNERDDSNQMHWFVIDFFNDVTGVDVNCHTNIGAKQLGEFSVTLFKNFLFRINI